MRLVPAYNADQKRVEMDGSALWVHIAPGEGEAGCFREEELADVISKKLKLRVKPLVAELERYAKSWESSLKETFGTTIQFAAGYGRLCGASG